MTVAALWRRSGLASWSERVTDVHGHADVYHFILAESVPDAVLAASLDHVRPHDPDLDGSVLVGTVCAPDQLVGIVAQLSLLGYTVLEIRRAPQARTATP